ncbi:MAG: RNA polymerase sigma factor [Actinomycetota bacterium]
MRKATVSSGSDERALVAALRAGDEAAFMTLVERYGPSMLRVARTFVPSPAVAEEVVQEAWLGVLRGLDRFERRSSLKTWIFRILTNVAKTRGERESRSVPFSSLAGDESAEPAVDPSRFDPSQGTQGMWAAPPASWEDVPEDRLLAGETLGEVRAAIAGLPPQQRTVITLRDVEGWTSDEVRNVLDISETNQRVLLHRARSKVRRALEEYVGRYERA